MPSAASAGPAANGCVRPPWLKDLAPSASSVPSTMSPFPRPQRSGAPHGHILHRLASPVTSIPASYPDPQLKPPSVTSGAHLRTGEDPSEPVRVGDGSRLEARLRFPFPLAVYIVASFAEIAGCCAVWSWRTPGGQTSVYRHPEPTRSLRRTASPASASSCRGAAGRRAALRSVEARP